MSSRDKYGNYVNDKGVTIKITQDKHGKDHISFYDGPVDGNHSAVHVNVNYSGSGSWDTKSHGPDHSDTSSGSGGCFLTTACMKVQAEDFDDNCHELQTLRWFRDNHISREDIDLYYRIAPAIVEQLDLRPDSAAIYAELYHKVICVCVDAIERCQYALAYSVYRSAVEDLQRQYLPQ